MKQVAHRLRDGSMEILDVPVPHMGRGTLLVRNHFSLVSAGTEGGTVATARKNLIGKARERPAQVRQVVETLKHQGITQTYRAISKRLDAYSPLGYSSAGIVVDVDSSVRGLSVGDAVACAGAGYANHAEIVAVPENLCVKLPRDADLSRAAYNTLGAIAFQGVRQADLRIGESCVVIGLGLIGQLTCLILKAGGIRVIGLDVKSSAVATAAKHCADHAFELTDPTLFDAVHRATYGIDADAVIITAATESTGPVNLAGRLLRKRGVVVVVGNVPTGFEREPDYYRKELTLRMSCSYGPGRYDVSYEEKGLDYPVGYVRWTENRNMQAFQQLVHAGDIDLDYMTTHRFKIDQAPGAYDLILKNTEEYLGIVIEYDSATTLDRKPIVVARHSGLGQGATGIAFIGAGSYASSHLLPNLRKRCGIRLTGVATSSGTSSRSVAEKFGFEYAASLHEDILADDNTGTVFIATRHDSHAQYVTAALQAGKNVFVEKPLCLKSSELTEIQAAWSRHKPVLMVGFNRRFSPLARRVKDVVSAGPVSMIYRVNAGAIPKESWIQDPDIGGGRIVGEICHFIDFMIFMSGSLPTRVYANALHDPSHLDDTINVNLTFENGSIGTICYFANGSRTLSKEYVEVYKSGIVARLLDFKEIEIYSPSERSRKKLLGQDKGQAAMTSAFIDSVTGKGPAPIPLHELMACTAASFAIEESLRNGQPSGLTSCSLG